MSSADLLALAERCEAASRPDQVLDEAIARAIGWRFVREGHPIGCVWYKPDGRAGCVPAYTASLDAAMTLVPENCLATVKQLWDGPQVAGYAVVAMYEDYAADCDGKLRRDVREGMANTIALALTAAALRARASQEPDNAG